MNHQSITLIHMVFRINIYPMKLETWPDHDVNSFQVIIEAVFNSLIFRDNLSNLRFQSR